MCRPSRFSPFKFIECISRTEILQCLLPISLVKLQESSPTRCEIPAEELWSIIWCTAFSHAIRSSRFAPFKLIARPLFSRHHVHWAHWNEHKSHQRWCTYWLPFIFSSWGLLWIRMPDFSGCDNTRPVHFQ